MKSLLSFLISGLIGTTVIVNGVTLNSEDIINETKRVVNETNIHQIETALEVYYVNKGHYPDAINREDMLSELLEDGYIRRAPANLVGFLYEVDDDGEDYILDY